MTTLTNPGHVAYAASSSSTASPAEVVRMAYARIVTACDRMTLAAETRRSGWIEQFHAEAVRAQRLLLELTGMLSITNEDPEVASLAKNLGSLYRFCIEELVAANLAKDARRCGPVRNTIDGLGSAWEASVCR
jgi:flagellar biosynthetic protein FliS